MSQLAPRARLWAEQVSVLLCVDNLKLYMYFCLRLYVCVYVAKKETARREPHRPYSRGWRSVPCMHQSCCEYVCACACVCVCYMYLYYMCVCVYRYTLTNIHINNPCIHVLTHPHPNYKKKMKKNQSAAHASQALAMGAALSTMGIVNLLSGCLLGVYVCVYICVYII